MYLRYSLTELLKIDSSLRERATEGEFLEEGFEFRCGILLTQKPNLLDPDKSIESSPSLLLIHPKLLQGHHAHDLDTSVFAPPLDSRAKH